MYWIIFWCAIIYSLFILPKMNYLVEIVQFAKIFWFFALGINSVEEKTLYFFLKSQKKEADWHYINKIQYKTESSNWVKWPDWGYELILYLSSSRIHLRHDSDPVVINGGASCHPKYFLAISFSQKHTKSQH